jgi:hypothetical protein
MPSLGEATERKVRKRHRTTTSNLKIFNVEKYQSIHRSVIYLAISPEIAFTESA